MSVKARAEFVVRQVTPILDELSMEAMIWLRTCQSVDSELSESLLVHLIANYCAKHALNTPKPAEFSCAVLSQLEAQIDALNVLIDEEKSALEAVTQKRKH
jgi:hypothetical protein